MDHQIEGAFHNNSNGMADEKRNQHFQATQSLIQSFSTCGSKQDVLDKVVQIVQKESGCQFVGIRVLEEDGYIPYQSYIGFSREFWEKENRIQLSKEDCSCTRIICGRLLPFDMPIINQAGSLCCNDTLAFAQTLSEDEKKMYRGACNNAGYRSVAVIPVVYNGAARGIIHMADLEVNKISAATMEFVEAIAPLVGEVIHRDILEKSLKISEEKKTMLESIVAGIENLACIVDTHTCEFIYASKAMEQLYGGTLAGRKCYEVLACSASCSQYAAPASIQDDSGPCTKEHYDEVHDRYYWAEKKGLTWLDGMVAEVIFVTDITKQRQAEQALLASNDDLENTVRELQETSVSLEEEIMERQAAQIALQNLNDELEDNVLRRTQELQEINAILEEEVAERQAAQDNLAKLNDGLEEKVAERTRDLQDINAALEEEIMERQAAEKSLRENRDKLAVSEARYRGLFENMQSILSYRKVIVDDNGRPVDLEHVAVNPAFAKKYGIEIANIEGVRLTKLFPGIEVEAFDWIRVLGEVALTGRAVIFEQYLKVVDTYFRVAAYSPEKGYVACIAEDITDRKRNEVALAKKREEIRRRAYFDTLTGLPNRTHFNERLSQEMEKARRGEASGAVLFIDLDDLKIVNDTYGHTYGDAFIIAAGKRIVAEVGDRGFIARIGGDEFLVILLDEKDRAGVAAIADRLIAALGQECNVLGKSFHMSASAGIAIYPGDGDTAEDIFKNVDMAMYAAKKAGKNGWRFYEESWQQETYEKMLLTNSLRHAVERGELLLYYQPQLTYTGTIIGFEALLRWNSPEHGFIPPLRFIPLAEQSGMIHKIGQWALFEACRFVRRLANSGWGDIHVAVNVSPYQLSADDFVDKVRDILATTGVNPHLLELEITENVLMSSLEENTLKISELKGMGLRLSLDDFGTGYSSLTYLQRLPVNVLKIDKSFVDAIERGDIRPGIIPAIVNMAHIMDMTVVAEGVETEQQFNYLSAIQCDFFQGYLASRPVPEEEAIRFLSRRT